MPVAPEYLHLVYPGETFGAFLYGRNSRDPRRRGRSVDDQLAESRAMCENHGWPVRGIFRDPDRSASRHARKKRDDFEDMVAGIVAGKCRILVAWEASRYYRDLEIYVRLRRLCVEHNVLLCYNGVVYDLSKREDRKATARDAADAEDESEGIRNRVLRTVRLQAEAGRPHGRILWGYARRYDPDTGDLIDQVPHQQDAVIVREVFRRVAAGETVYGIVADLNRRGVQRRGTHGVWREYHLSDMLRNRGYIGRRIHQGKDIGPARWIGIIDETTFYAVQRIVSDPRRLTVRDRSVRHLLSGIARCGACKSRPVLRIRKTRGHLAYMCIEKFHTSMHEEKMDAYVEEAVVAWCASNLSADAFRDEAASGAVAAALVLEAELSTQLAEARRRATTVGPDGRLLLSVASLAALEARLLPQLEAGRERARISSVPAVVRDLVGQPDADRRWAALDIHQQRAALREVVAIRLNRARARGVRTIEPGRIDLVFYGQPGFAAT